MEYQCRGCRNTDCNLHWKDPDSRWMNCTNFIAQPQTNADRLRAMSDEELAKFFGTLPCCPPGSAEELCYPENTCGADTKMMVKCWETWLKATVEEG